MNTAISPNIKGMSPLLLIADLDNSISFYTLYLGFRLDFRYEDFYAGISKDVFTIHFKLGYPSEEEQQKRQKKEDLDLVFLVSQIHELYEAIKSTSINIIQPLREMPYGREFYITDPDDYIISFLE